MPRTRPAHPRPSPAATRRRSRRRPVLAVALVAVAAGAATVLPTAPPAVAEPGRHRIAPGETLSEVAEDVGTSVAALADANGIADPDHVVAGRVLVVPAAAPDAGAGDGGPSVVRASRRHLDDVFDRWAEANAVSPSLLKAMCFHESGWQDDVISSAGAEGVCQIMPDTEDHLEALIGQELDSLDAEDNIRLGARYLRWLLARTDGDVEQALAGYYQGLSSVRRNGPFAETDTYVETVLALQRRF